MERLVLEKCLDELRRDVAYIRKALFEGNGQESILVRISRLEERDQLKEDNDERGSVNTKWLVTTALSVLALAAALIGRLM